MGDKKKKKMREVQKYLIRRIHIIMARTQAKIKRVPDVLNNSNYLF